MQGTGTGSRDQSHAGSVKEMGVRLDCFKENLWIEEMPTMKKTLNLETFLLWEAQKPRHVCAEMLGNDGFLDLAIGVQEKYS